MWPGGDGLDAMRLTAATQLVCRDGSWDWEPSSLHFTFFFFFFFPTNAATVVGECHSPCSHLMGVLDKLWDPICICNKRRIKLKLNFAWDNFLWLKCDHSQNVCLCFYAVIPQRLQIVHVIKMRCRPWIYASGANRTGVHPISSLQTVFFNFLVFGIIKSWFFCQLRFNENWQPVEKQFSQQRSNFPSSPSG